MSVATHDNQGKTRTTMTKPVDIWDKVWYYSFAPVCQMAFHHL